MDAGGWIVACVLLLTPMVYKRCADMKNHLKGTVVIETKKKGFKLNLRAMIAK